MNPIDDQLERLLRASGGGGTMRFEPPFGLETRVLAAWREANRFDVWSPALLVRGLLAALVIMMLSFWPILSRASNPDADYLQLADSTVQVNNDL